MSIYYVISVKRELLHFSFPQVILVSVVPMVDSIDYR